MYWKKFIEAADRTSRFGLVCPEIPTRSNGVISNRKLEKIPEAVYAAVGELSPAHVVAQCLSINLALKEPLERFFGLAIIYTIGYVETNNEALFKQTEKQLRVLLQQGMRSPRLQLHAWLTLASGEIIDLSLPTSIAFFHKLEEGKGGVIASRPDELEGLRYCPMLLGHDFLRKIGALVEF